MQDRGGKQDIHDRQKATGNGDSPKSGFQSSRIRSSENNIQLSDGRGRNANVQQATAHRYRESCGHHGIRVVEGVVRVHITGRQNGTRCTGYRGASKGDLSLDRLRQIGIDYGERHDLIFSRC
jgi:hypothetical protein